jgi:hypothetical protein
VHQSFHVAPPFRVVMLLVELWVVGMWRERVGGTWEREAAGMWGQRVRWM